VTPASATRPDRWLVRATTGLAGLAVAAAAAILVLIVASVALRYVEGRPLRFTEDLAGLLVAALLLLALPRVTLEGRHVTVRLVVDRLSGRARRIADAAGRVVLLTFCLWWLVAAWPWFAFTYERDLKSAVARLPLTPWVALVPACAALLALIAARQLLRPSGRAADRPNLPSTDAPPE